MTNYQTVATISFFYDLNVFFFQILNFLKTKLKYLAPKKKEKEKKDKDKTKDKKKEKKKNKIEKTKTKEKKSDKKLKIKECFIPS